MLEPAIAQLESVARLDPQSATAQRRLGQIKLSLGDLVQAKAHLEAAAAIHPNERVARQLLGEIYALEGDAEAAARMWSTLQLGQRQLETRLAWYTETNNELGARRLADAIQLTALVLTQQQAGTQGETK